VEGVSAGLQVSPGTQSYSTRVCLWMMNVSYQSTQMSPLEMENDSSMSLEERPEYTGKMVLVSVVFIVLLLCTMPAAHPCVL
jgi:hypothetical protein